MMRPPWRGGYGRSANKGFREMKQVPEGLRACGSAASGADEGQTVRCWRCVAQVARAGQMTQERRQMNNIENNNSDKNIPVGKKSYLSFIIGDWVRTLSYCNCHCE